jgi:hypothetical protein
MCAKTYLTIVFVAFVVILNGESYPSPAQGPPIASGSNIQSYPIAGGLTYLLKGAVEQKLVQVNASLAARTDVRAKVTLAPLVVSSPILKDTQYTDRPNHRYVWVYHRLEVKISDIQFNAPVLGWTGYPWNRKVSVSVDVNCFCDGWEMGQGKIKIVADPEPPYLDPDPSFSEAAVNFFLGSWLVPFINGKITESLTAPGGFSQTLGLTKCNSLAAFTGDPSTRDDDGLHWNEPPLLQPYPGPAITVRPTRIKRLQAHRLDGRVLYNQSESPVLDIWAGFGRWYYDELPSMVEGQEVLLPAPGIQVSPHPASGASLVVIANTTHFYEAISDSAFRTFSPALNYGNGTQTVVVSKTYWLPPESSHSKPLKVIVPAYEITFEVNSPGGSAPPGRF